MGRPGGGFNLPLALSHGCSTRPQAMQPESDHPHHRPLLALGLRLAAALVLAGLLACVKLASERGIHLAEIMFWRQLPTIPILLGWFALRRQLGTLKTARMGSHLRRSGFGMVGMTMNFGAATLLPLAVATTLNYSSAIFAVVLSALVLREPTGVWRWSAVALGFTGVVVIAQPWGGELPLLGAAIALGAALMIALISVQLRDLGRTEHPFTIVFYFSLFSVPVLALAMPFVGQAHPLEDWLLLLACGVIGLLGQVLLTAALRYGMVAKGFSKTVESLTTFEQPLIVFWNFNHFVVVEGFGDGVVFINDPAVGHRAIDDSEFETSRAG